MNRFLAFLIATFLLSSSPGLGAQTTDPESIVRQIWQQLDYVGVDYAGAVGNGQVTNEFEYAEMREFVGNAHRQVQELPGNPGHEAVVTSVSALKTAVEQRAHPSEVSRLARQASDLLLKSYPIPVAPTSVPDLRRAAALYQAQCASCHGATGKADGPLAARLDPPPIAFSDSDRAKSRSVLALYQTITQGVAGTSMPSFSGLPEEDRWALAFFSGTLSHDSKMRERGAAQWTKDPEVRTKVPDLAALTTATEISLAQSLGNERARDVMAFLRSEPQTVTNAETSGVALARSQLKRSLEAARSGDFAGATRLGLSAYLDGFEPVEPILGSRNKPLLDAIEKEMLAYRAAISAKDIDTAVSVAQRLQERFNEAQAELETRSDALATFLGAFTILLREGLEALLIVVGMLAFLRKAGRNDVVRHVHAGWIIALLAGGATWAIATYAVGISGASREVTEGVSSLFAAIVLLAVGLWMHQKSTAGRWQAYLKEKLSSAMSRRSVWGLFLLSFIAVYREVFETVLFFSAMAVDGNGTALLGGLATGVVTLSVVAWVLMRTSARMPIGRFFSLSSVLVAILAVVLAGKGVAGLQEAGWVNASYLAVPKVEILGLYPSLETVGAQLLVLAIALLGFLWNAQTARRLSAA